MAFVLVVVWILAGAGSLALVTSVLRERARALDIPDSTPLQLSHEVTDVLGWTLSNGNDVIRIKDGRLWGSILGVRTGQKVADIGCGTGVFTLTLAEQVGRTGHVYAVDLDPDCLAYVEARARALGLDWVEGVRSTDTSVKLPAASVNGAIMINVVHCFVNRRLEDDAKRNRTIVLPFFRSIHRSLAPGGRLLIFDHPGTGPSCQWVRRITALCGLKPIRYHDHPSTGYWVLCEKR